MKALKPNRLLMRLKKVENEAEKGLSSAHKWHLAATALIFMLATSACAPAQFSKAGGGGDGVGPHVCDPFGGGTTGTSNGLKGQIYYSEGVSGWEKLSDYLSLGTKSPAQLFMSQVNVPTRAFSSGFVAEENGQPLKKASGETLVEWFALQLQSQIQLMPGDFSGDVQFAVLSDDGVRFQVDAGSGLQSVVEDDNVHPTKLGCANQPVRLEYGKRFPMQLDYFQGPRYHIALTLMWRPWTASVEPLCGQMGNDLFFNSDTTPSTPMAAYHELLARGWRPLNANNFVIPGGGTNPCANKLSKTNY